MGLTKEQLKERLGYIGASDAAAVLGLSRWATPLSVWAEKTGEVEPEDISDKLHIEVGTELESLVCKLFTKRTGKKITNAPKTFYHSKYPFLAANLDGIIESEDAVFEAKTASGWKAKEWEGESIPQEYIVQVLHQLAVTGKKIGYIACLIGGNADFRWKVVPRDEKAIAQIIKKEVDFWQKFVLPKVMPLTITKNDSDTLFKLFPMGINEEPVELGPKADILVDTLKALQQDEKALKGQIDKTRNEIKAMLKDAEIGFTANWRITWRNQISKRVNIDKLKEKDWDIYLKYAEEGKSRVLRFSDIKKTKEAK